MRARIQKWGNSLGLRIPKAFAADTGVSEGSEVDLTLEDGRLVITPRGPRYTLNDLLSDVTDENRHGEVDVGTPRGSEAW